MVSLQVEEFLVFHPHFYLSFWFSLEEVSFIKPLHLHLHHSFQFPNQLVFSAVGYQVHRESLEEHPLHSANRLW